MAMPPDTHSERPRSLRAVLQAVYGSGLSGVVEAHGPRGIVQIHAKEGRVTRVVPPPGSEWLLGHALVEGGELRERSLYRLRRKALRKKRRIEDLLVDRGLVSADVLARYLELQLRESILPLFLEHEVLAEFRGEPPAEEPHLRPVSIPYLLKEGERRAAEWAGLAAEAPPLSAVFEKTEASLAEFLRPAEGEGGEGCGATERLVYYYLNGRKTLQQVAFASGLGDFETLRALHLLRRRGFVRLLDRAGIGEQPDDPGLLPGLVRFSFYLVLLGALAGLFFFRPLVLDEFVTRLESPWTVLDETVAQARLTRVAAAVELFYAEQGRYPERLGELNAAGLLLPDEVARCGVRFDYTPRKDGYELAIAD